VGLAAGLGLGNGLVGLAQDLPDIPRPGLPVGVQVQHALQVADQVSSDLAHPGQIGVELVPAPVAVADQVAMPAVQHPEVSPHTRPAAEVVRLYDPLPLRRRPGRKSPLIRCLPSTIADR
jgi:hypothetical protein